MFRLGGVRLLQSGERKALNETGRKSQRTISQEFMTIKPNRSKVLFQTEGKAVSRQFARALSTGASGEVHEAEVITEAKSFSKATEKITGQQDTHVFQAETSKLLDIVAKSLYSEREVFVRELISNASDALEKLHLHKVSGDNILDPSLEEEIHIETNEADNTLCIQDFGIGMTKEEMIKNLGTIAHSGTGEFLRNAAADPDKKISTDDLIGQFGVGFYSSFMVADSVTVYSRSATPGSQAWCWKSTGAGSYEIAEASGVTQGTKIVIHLKPTEKKFSVENSVKDII